MPKSNAHSTSLVDQRPPLPSPSSQKLSRLSTETLSSIILFSDKVFLLIVEASHFFCLSDSSSEVFLNEKYALNPSGNTRSFQHACFCFATCLGSIFKLLGLLMGLIIFGSLQGIITHIEGFPIDIFSILRGYFVSGRLSLIPYIIIVYPRLN